MQQIWYVAYGSNLSFDRFCRYLRGGPLSGSERVYAGCRDTSDPLESVGVMMSGSVYFAGRSSVWRSGMAFYDPDVTGEVAARAYRITAEQFVDVLAQETRRKPGVTLDLAPAFRGDRFSVGLGGYSVLVRIGDRDGLPLMTFTADRGANPPLKPPSAVYLSAMATGLREAHGWSSERIDRYLASLPGIIGPVRPPLTAATG